MGWFLLDLREQTSLTYIQHTHTINSIKMSRFTPGEWPGQPTEIEKDDLDDANVEKHSGKVGANAIVRSDAASNNAPINDTPEDNTSNAGTAKSESSQIDPEENDAKDNTKAEDEGIPATTNTSSLNDNMTQLTHSTATLTINETAIAAPSFESAMVVYNDFLHKISPDKLNFQFNPFPTPGHFFKHFSTLFFEFYRGLPEDWQSNVAGWRSGEQSDSKMTSANKLQLLERIKIDVIAPDSGSPLSRWLLEHLQSNYPESGRRTFMLNKEARLEEVIALIERLKVIYWRKAEAARQYLIEQIRPTGVEPSRKRALERVSFLEALAPAQLAVQSCSELAVAATGVATAFRELHEGFGPLDQIRKKMKEEVDQGEVDQGEHEDEEAGAEEHEDEEDDEGEDSKGDDYEGEDYEGDDDKGDDDEGEHDEGDDDEGEHDEGEHDEGEASEGEDDEGDDEEDEDEENPAIGMWQWMPW